MNLDYVTLVEISGILKITQDIRVGTNDNNEFYGYKCNATHIYKKKNNDKPNYYYYALTFFGQLPEEDQKLIVAGNFIYIRGNMTFYKSPAGNWNPSIAVKEYRILPFFSGGKVTSIAIQQNDFNSQNQAKNNTETQESQPAPVFFDQNLSKDEDDFILP